MEYNEARSIMATHKANILRANGNGKIGSLAPDRKKLKFRTFLYRKESPADNYDETYEIHYFQTAIITLYSHKVVLNDGNFFSHSTHERLNEYMPSGFRVHGSTAPWYKSPVGFVRTPAGTAPYNMPQAFTYGGLPIANAADKGLYSIEAGACFHMIPSYVDGLLSRVFKEPNHAMNDMPVTDDEHQLSDHAWPVMLLKKQLHRPMLLRYVFNDRWFVPEKSFRRDHFAGEDIESVVDLLLNEGSSVFVEPKTKYELTKRIEASLRLSRTLPIINRRVLKKFLRMVLIEFLVDQLGFHAQEWNRRDAS